MSLKRYVILGSVTAFISAVMLSLPAAAAYQIPDVAVTSLWNVHYQDSVSANGYLSDPMQTQITCSYPIVPDQIFVKTGDYVEAGDVIATVDYEETKNALAQILKLSELFPEEAVSVMADLGDSENVKLVSSVIPQSIISNQTGTITSLNLHNGVLLYPSENAASVSNGTTLEACLQVPEEYASQIEPGQAVSLTAPAQKESSYSGTVKEISPSAQTVFSGTTQETVVNITVSLADWEGLKSGYSVKGKIQIGQPQIARVLPYEAVGQDEEGKEFVYCLNQGKAIRQTVETGKELSEGIEVLSGITREQWVVADWSDIEESGQRIHPYSQSEEEDS